MFTLIFITILKALFAPLHSLRKEIISNVLIIAHQNIVLKRKLDSKKKRVIFSNFARLLYSLFYGITGKVSKFILLVQPETVLKWYRNYLKKRWDFSKHPRKPGRPPVPDEIKALVLTMKNDNMKWGNKKIQGELLKLGISLDKKTISKIIQDFRKRGKIKSKLTWKKFLKSHLETMYAMDFFNVQTISNKVFYVFFIIHIKSREIVHFDIPEFQTRQFIRQQISDFTWNIDDDIKRYVIHDNAPAFSDQKDFFESCGIEGVRLPAYSPNLNAFAERFVKSVRNEALDYFIIFNEKQLRNIITRYIRYYNRRRAHQGIEQNIPAGYVPQTEGKVVSFPVLSGLHHHYERKTA